MSTYAASMVDIDIQDKRTVTDNEPDWHTKLLHGTNQCLASLQLQKKYLNAYTE